MSQVVRWPIRKEVQAGSGPSEIPLSTLRSGCPRETQNVIHQNDEHAREVEKLRVQIQSMEEEIRRLYQSRYQLDQANKQNEKLVTTLQEAKAQIEALRAEVEKLTAPPSTYAIFSSLNQDGTGNVYVSGRKMKVSLHPSIKRAKACGRDRKSS